MPGPAHAGPAPAHQGGPLTTPPTVPIPERALPLLAGRPIGFMSTMRPDGHMSTNPVAVVWDGAVLRVSTTTDRRKHRNLLGDDRVTLCVVQPDNLNRYVEIRGRAVVEPDVDRRFVDAMARQYMDVDRYPFDRPGQERVVVTILPEQVSCPSIPLADDPPYTRADPT
jgi:PPOX class probable F420-dependent enzyme